MREVDRLERRAATRADGQPAVGDGVVRLGGLWWNLGEPPGCRESSTAGGRFARRLPPSRSAVSAPRC